MRLFEDMLSFEPIVVDAETKALNFSGSSPSDPLRVILYDSLTDRFDVNNLIQSYQLAFPAAEFPLPRWWSPWGSASLENSLETRMETAFDLGPLKLFSARADVVQSLVPNHGDYRLVASKRVITPDVFVPHPLYGKARMAHALMDYVGNRAGVRPLPGASFEGEFIPGVDYPSHRRPDFPISPANEAWANDAHSRHLSLRGPITPAATGDFDTGVGNGPDGPYINKADDGDVRGLKTSKAPYFDTIRQPREKAQALFSPNRLVPGSGMFGSLPTGVQASIPWQTLLFRPMPQSNHYGAKDPPDHLWMDLFWMPVVQPYAISEPFSGAGKINLNYQIVPFTYIKRATGMHAVMKAEKMLAIPENAGRIYKDGAGGQDWRRFINIDETLKQWDEKFENGEVFRTASEICEMYLVPEGERWTSSRAMEHFWEKHTLTGDNVKERPYANLYPRLTVRSNSFTVHMIAQSLTKVKGTPHETWVTGRDKVAGEFRGSATIERHIDPNDPAIPDYAENARRGLDSPSLDDFYAFRVVNVKRFAP